MAKEISLEDVRNAVFRLLLAPNDGWARGKLLLYLRYGPLIRAYFTASAGRNAPGGYDALDIELAMQSRAVSRIALGIHRYDRYKEPLLKFLSRDVINAYKDLFDTRKRHYEQDRSEAENPESKKEPAEAKPRLSIFMMDEADMERLIKASGALKVSSDRLLALLGLILARRERHLKELSVEQIQSWLGADADSLKKLLDGRGPRIPKGFQLQEHFVDIDDIGEEYDIDTKGTLELNRPGEANGGIHTLSQADLKFQRYIDGLIDKKADGELVGGAPRRRNAGEDNQEHVKSQFVQAIQMSEEEIMATLDILRAERKKLEEEAAKVQPDLPKEVPLPPVSEFESWYDEAHKGAWGRKRREIHMFVYQVRHLQKKRCDGKKLDAMFKEQFGRDPETSADKVLKEYDKPAMEAFMKWLAQKNAK